MTKNWLTGYKLVFKEHGKMLSLTFEKGEGLEYKIGKITKPKKGWGPMAVFDTKKNVKFFCSIYRWSGANVRLLKVEYTPSRLNFLRKIIRGNSFVSTHSPTGTLFAKEVKPIKVERRNNHANKMSRM